MAKAAIQPASRCYGFRWDPTYKGELDHKDKCASQGFSSCLLPDSDITWCCNATSRSYHTCNPCRLYPGAKEGFCLTDRDVRTSRH